MTARTHDLASFATLVTVSAYYPPSQLNISTMFTCLIGSVVGALIPDLDQASNRLWDLLPAGNLIGKIFRNLLLEHRTISHSLLGLYLNYLILSFLVPKFLNPLYIDSSLVIISILLGSVSHVAADMLTREGVPLFFPLPVKIGIPPFKSLRITTGKFAERFIVFPGIIIYLIWFFVSRRAELLSVISLIHS